MQLFKKITAYLLIFAAASLLCGCDALLSANGTASIKADDIHSVTVTASENNYTFTVMDRESIRDIVKQINRYTLESPQDAQDKFQYSILLSDTDGNAVFHLIVLNETAVQTDAGSFSADAQKLCYLLETLECATLTDEALIQKLFTERYADRMKITDENGNLSLDKIFALKNTCPALFELLSRPTILTSLGSYGMNALTENLSSDNIKLQEHAENICQILKNLIPSLESQITEILENSKNKP